MTNTQNIILNHKGKIELFSEVGKNLFIISLNILRKVPGCTLKG
jgi:nitrogen-specific signal transduction histidine kinase